MTNYVPQAKMKTKRTNIINDSEMTDITEIFEYTSLYKRYEDLMSQHEEKLKELDNVKNNYDELLEAHENLKDATGN